MSDQGPRGDRVSGVPRGAAEQHPRSAELRRPELSLRSTSRLTSRSTITCRRSWRRRRHAGESSEICTRGTTPGRSVTHVGAPWPKSSNAPVRRLDPPSGGVRGEAPIGAVCALMRATGMQWRVHRSDIPPRMMRLRNATSARGPSLLPAPLRARTSLPQDRAYTGYPTRLNTGRRQSS